MTFRHTATALLVITTATLAACSTEATAPVTPQSVTASSSDNGVSSASSSASRVRVEIALKGSAAYPNAKGKARFSSKPGERELQVEVENVATGTSLNFYVGGAQVGTTQVADALRQARINLNTTLGQSVPTGVAGQSVEVKTTAGVLVASGSF
ncbi:MAG TPA: hypothetical protein VFV33_04225 [Gemmatimonadaceae bacterium]|nr:hypothetical protein [Gemmatimonadaceae bacterium]